jgi:hypothetical protein
MGSDYQGGPAGTVSFISSLGAAPTPLIPPSISGVVQAGQTLSGSPGAWTSSPTSIVYQWLNEGSAIPGATSSSYLLQNGDTGCLISLKVTVTNQYGSTTAFSPLVGPTLGTTVFYVSQSSGLDTNAGTLAAPWKTLAKVNAQMGSFGPGTSILFKRGDTWRTDGGPSPTKGAQLNIGFNVNGAAGNPIVFDAYGVGPNPIIDGSYDASHTSDWINIGTNLWKSAQTFPPPTTNGCTITIASPAVITNTTFFPPTANGQSVIFATTGALPTGLVAGTIYYVINLSGSTFNVAATPGGAAINTSGTQSGTQTYGGNGLPYNAANDIGNILWGFSPVNSPMMPPALNNASVGLMTGGGTGGIWYLPGDAQAHLTAQGQWNFNTDNWTVQVYSVGNPATKMPGLSLAVSTVPILINQASYITIQNITIQYAGFNPILTTNNIVSLIIRDCTLQWCGGGNIGGKSDANSRAGDGFDQNFSLNGFLIERCLIRDMYDVAIGYEGGGAFQSNLTVRNCIFVNCDEGLAAFASPANASGLYAYNNTMVDNGSWSNAPVQQRPNGFSNEDGFNVFATGQTNIAIANNIFAALYSAGINGTHWGTNDPHAVGFTQLDYNVWPNRTLDNTPNTIELTGGNFTIVSWAPGTLSGRTFSPPVEVNGKFVDPMFTNQAGLNFYPKAGSVCFNAGANFYSTVPPGVSGAVGLVWDFFRNPRPSTGPFTIGALQ